MLSLLLFVNTLLFSLRLSGNGSFPRPLSASEEREWLDRLGGGSPEEREEARRVLIERNLRLVAHIVKKYYAQSSDQEDLVSIGTIGLIKGISSFDPSKGARLATYAARCIENGILTPAHLMRQMVTLSPSRRPETLQKRRNGGYSAGLMRVCTSCAAMLTECRIMPPSTSTASGLSPRAS